jgi:hypothetical protein
LIDFNGYPELCLGDPYAESPEMTFRECFTRYEPEGLDTFEENWGLEPNAPFSAIENPPD